MKAEMGSATTLIGIDRQAEENANFRLDTLASNPELQLDQERPQD